MGILNFPTSLLPGRTGRPLAPLSGFATSLAAAIVLMISLQHLALGWFAGADGWAWVRGLALVGLAHGLANGHGVARVLAFGYAVLAISLASLWLLGAPSALSFEVFVLQAVVASALSMLMLGVSSRLLLGFAWLAFVVQVAYTALIVTALHSA